ncbi:glycosyltransferase [candidate division WWE3 bacterium]|uniref:Glycosyltransferase n=1 Tax=candidate division WWE3 bacterium TaxID=2053526 RepID=A0A955ED12_UNCKA|nr:glycosyltransferase [candidate division WWE3 bacterium]
MKVAYHIPSLYTIYAGRTIYNGYKNAFEDLGDQFFTWSAETSLEDIRKFAPDILMTSFNSYSLKFLDMELFWELRKKGTKVFVNVPFWNSPISRLRVNETPSLSTNKEHIKLIKDGYGDVFYNICEQGDARMEGFEKTTGYKHHTLPLAIDKTVIFPEYCAKFKADISFLGTNLPDKRPYFNEMVFPLAKKYDLKLYGQDWTALDRILGLIQKGGQYFNVPLLRSLQKPKLQLEDERRIYSSSVISINVHEEYQRQFGGDCNERTFKIPACDGFEITDDVDVIRKYFKDEEEIIIAKDKADWFEKIDYFIKNPEKRIPIIAAGKKRVLAEHTYHNRVKYLLSLSI